MIEKTVRLIIAGGRDFTNYTMLEDTLDKLLINVDYEKLEIVSGGARGADKLGDRFAKEYGLPIKHFIPDWDGLGKRAGMVRNREMAEYATHLVAYWNQESRGTQNMIDTARSLGLNIRVVKY